MLVREPVSVVDDGDFGTDGSSPFVVPTVVDVSIDVTYATRGVRFVDTGVAVAEVLP